LLSLLNSLKTFNGNLKFELRYEAKQLKGFDAKDDAKRIRREESARLNLVLCKSLDNKLIKKLEKNKRVSEWIKLLLCL